MPAPTDALFLEESFRWFGPADPVPLSYIRQAGATAVFTALHEIPYGELWPREAVRQRKEVVENAGLRWTAVESLPVHEDIKRGAGDLERWFHNYRQSMRHLAAEGIKTIVYNFMPVLDWVRTDFRHRLPDGSECLRFDPVKFAAFELCALRRPGAEASYDGAAREAARRFWRELADPARAEFVQGIIDVFPGCKLGLQLNDIRNMLARYEGSDASGLRKNLARFHSEIMPLAGELGINMAIHPDDPPFPILGLPRIVKTAGDLDWIFAHTPAPSNGLCFCTGSLGAREDNDLTAMARRFGPRIHAAHLRSTQREAGGSFFEADHLAGSVDMPGVMGELLREQDRRRSIEGSGDWRLPFRPDHGHTMMDDLGKPVPPTPGYSCIGRMRGLAELRGLMRGLRHRATVGRS